MKRGFGYLGAVSVALLLLVVGCSSNLEQKLVGKYKGEIGMDPKSEKDDMAAAFAKALLGNLSLELKADKTFSMSIMVPVEGTWSVSGDRLLLKVSKAMGMSVEDLEKGAASEGKPAADLEQMKEPLEFSVSSDGKTLTAIPKKGQEGQGDLVFKREG